MKMSKTSNDEWKVEMKIIEAHISDESNVSVIVWSMTFMNEYSQMWSRSLTELILNHREWKTQNYLNRKGRRYEIPNRSEILKFVLEKSFFFLLLEAEKFTSNSFPDQ